jgi:hypothetical protein
MNFFSAHMTSKNSSGVVWSRLLMICVLSWLSWSCAERGKNNPFDPNGQLKIYLNVTSNEQGVELSWDKPNLEGYSGFRIHRRWEGVDSTFRIIETNLPPESRQYIDKNASYLERYSYYLTVIGEGIESKPSNTVSIVPGPGDVWIVDKWGYQLVHSTYDVEHVVANYYTNWPPTDLAIATNLQKGLILYNNDGIIEGFDMISLQSLAQITTIKHPFKVLYDQEVTSFWVIDSSGYLYRIDASTFEVHLVPSILDKPVLISISGQGGHIDIVDQGLNKIIKLDHNGNYFAEINTVQGHPLVQPESYVESPDLRHFWLVDDTGNWDRIYARPDPGNDFQCLDSLAAAGDISCMNDSALIWIVNLDNFDSSVLQLSASGTRQLELTGFYNPYDLEINRYDGTLLVADSGNRRVVHYDRHQQVLGTNFNLNFPIKVMVE